MTRFDDLYSTTGSDGPRWPLELTSALDLGRARGALLGLAVGDALGTTVEFEQRPPASFRKLLKGPLREIRGGGPFNVAPGQVTDDTQMATCLCLSLVDEKGFDVEAVAASYVRWSRLAFDAGYQTRAALSRIARGTPAVEAGRRVWIEKGRAAAGNGSLMRTAPIAVAYAHRPGRRRAVSMVDSAITHFDPRCQLACAAFNAALAAAIGGPPGVGAAAMLAAARDELGEAAGWMVNACPGEGDLVEAALEDLRGDLAAAESDEPELYSRELHLHHMMGFVRVAFRLAFWHLVHTDEPVAALIDTVNRGGDADTNGAIVGALLGACHGEEALPAQWRQLVLNALRGEKSPFAVEYHPRQLLVLLEHRASGSPDETGDA
jgi:ADP-ribosyl-[dinitrogen reductase] hydrolase